MTQVLTDTQVKAIAQAICKKLLLPKSGGAYCLLQPVVRDIEATILEIQEGQAGGSHPFTRLVK